VERSHRTDDEAFYRPYLLQAHNVRQFLQLSARWMYVYNVLRPHSGVGMDHQPPLAVLQRLGYTGDERIALFPPVLLDAISTDLLLSCCPETGNDLLAHYTCISIMGHAFTGETLEILLDYHRRFFGHFCERLSCLVRARQNPVPS